MRLCYSTLAIPAYTVEQALHATQEWGFDGIELRTLCGTPNLWEVPDFWEGNLGGTARRFADAGVEIPVYATGVSFSRGGREFQTEQLEQLYRCVEVSLGLGCRQLRVFGGPLAPGQSREDGLAWAIEGYQRALEYADSAGVTLLLETHDDYSTAEELLPLLTPLKGMKVVWDVMHPARCGEAPRDTYRSLGDWIVHVHIKDGKVRGRDDVEPTAPGQGDIPIREAVGLLQEDGYGGYYCCEWERYWHPELAPAQQVLPRFASYMKSIVSQ